MHAQRIIEIAEDGRFLGVERGFLIIKNQGLEIGKIPLSDIAAVVCTSNWSVLSTSAISALSAEAIPLVVCDKVQKYPKCITLPLVSNYRQSDIMQAQSEASLPLRKSLWRDMVKAKILQQSEILKFFDKIDDSQKLYSISAIIKSGDSENCEARCAAIYWKALMGEHFKRDREREDANVLLNYAYTIERAAMVRAIVSAGLHPSLGIHHKSSTNTMRLADDLMEVFRPLADLEVKNISLETGGNELTVSNKKRLVNVINRRIFAGESFTSVQTMMHRLSKSLAQVYLKEREGLDISIVRSKYLKMNQCGLADID